MEIINKRLNLKRTPLTLPWYLYGIKREKIPRKLTHRPIIQSIRHSSNSDPERIGENSGENEFKPSSHKSPTVFQSIIFSAIFSAVLI